jgi:hypothetical protein
MVSCGTGVRTVLSQGREVTVAQRQVNKMRAAIQEGLRSLPGYRGSHRLRSEDRSLTKEIGGDEDTAGNWANAVLVQEYCGLGLACQPRQKEKVRDPSPRPAGREEEGKIIHDSALSAALREIAKRSKEGQHVFIATNSSKRGKKFRD